MGAFWGLPRARAAWRLHDLAVLFADYGLCMGGPTGAVLLRDQPSEFWKLIRRRLVAAPGNECVFAKCATLAQRLTGLNSLGVLHGAQAKEFAEWGVPSATLGLQPLRQAMPDLSDLAEGAWPFLRSSVAVLVKPSLGAIEAMHPVGTAQPGTLVGLQLEGRIFRSRRVTDRGWFVVTSNGHDTRAVRSRDRGRKWTSTSPWQSALQGTGDRCSSDGSDRAFGLDEHRPGSGPSIVYYDHDTRTGQSWLGGPNHQVISLGCDENAGVAITQFDKGNLGIWLCIFDQSCKPLPTPPIFEDSSAGGIDVARTRGSIVIAITQGSVVRVVSSRDDGRSYTPFTVVIDHDECSSTPHSDYSPANLLAIAGNLILTQEATSDKIHTLAIVSNDFGASWHALN